MNVFYLKLNGNKIYIESDIVIEEAKDSPEDIQLIVIY